MPGGPGPLAHAVEALAVLHLVAVDELLVGEDVAVRVDDALREPGRPRRVVELRGSSAEVSTQTKSAGAASSVSGSRTSVSGAHGRSNRGAFCLVGDEQPRAGVGEPVLDPVVAVQHRHREQDRAELPDAEEDRGRLGRGRQDDGDAVAPLDAARGERVRRPVREVLQLAPDELSRRAVEALPDHRRLVARMLVAHVGGDVVPRRHLPAVGRADLVVAARAHVATTRSSHAQTVSSPRRLCGGEAPWPSAAISTRSPSPNCRRRSPGARSA